LAPNGDGVDSLSRLTRFASHSDGVGSLLIQTRLGPNSEIICCGVRLNECRSSDLNITWKVLNIR
jgi:hypothetical protein